MKRVFYFIAFILLAFVSFQSCKTSKNVSSIDVKVDDTITVVVKDTVKIELVSNPSTGYRWQYVENSKEKNVEFLKDEYSAPKTEVVGQAGKQTLTFLANKKGGTILELKYARGNGTPSKTHKVWVIINKE